ncbi:hypothetical protein PPM_0098 [Paenibacillus polymyxa M1]|nr:hypothetical protein PPM_0098 [Paenibacillus polymyxa M1]
MILAGIELRFFMSTTSVIIIITDELTPQKVSVLANIVGFTATAGGAYEQ